MDKAEKKRLASEKKTAEKAAKAAAKEAKKVTQQQARLSFTLPRFFIFLGAAGYCKSPNYQGEWGPATAVRPFVVTAVLSWPI